MKKRIVIITILIFGLYGCTEDYGIEPKENIEVADVDSILKSKSTDDFNIEKNYPTLFKLIGNGPVAGANVDDLINLEITLKSIYVRNGEIIHMKLIFETLRRRELKIAINRSEDSNYKYDSKTISLKEISGEHLIEELFHAYQDAVLPYGLGPYNHNRAIIEFEAKVFASIHLAFLNGYIFKDDFRFIFTDELKHLATPEELGKLNWWFELGWGSFRNYYPSKLLDNYDDIFNIFLKY